MHRFNIMLLLLETRKIESLKYDSYQVSTALKISFIIFSENIMRHVAALV